MTAEQAQHAQGHSGLPQPEVGDEMHPLLRKVMENIKLIAIVFGALVVIFGGYALYDYVQEQRLDSAGEMLGEILVSTEGQERIQALEGFIGQAPDALKAGALLELAAAQQQAGDYEAALEVWTRLEGRGDATLAPVIVLGKAQALVETGKQEQALTLLTSYKAKAPESYKNAVEQRIAEVAEEAGKIDQALAAYRELADNEQLGPSIRDYLQFKIAELEAQQKG